MKDWKFWAVIGVIAVLAALVIRAEMQRRKEEGTAPRDEEEIEEEAAEYSATEEQSK